MELVFDHYPVFEANQVLNSSHLNDVFDYLDQQTRLTRSNLVGIGIVCGLSIDLDTTAAATLRLSKGCGVTSEGYLIVEPEDLSLVAYRPYLLPADLDYAPLKDNATKTQYPLWELFAAGEPGTKTLDSSADFLDDKAVLLLLELKKQGLRNCSPNNCDDKGSEVTARVRRLIIRSADLDKVIAAAQHLGDGLTVSDVDSALSAKLELPDLRMPRFDVLNTAPVTSNDVYARFLEIFRTAKLAQATATALSAAYAAFKPLLQGTYASDPFAGFPASFGFLDRAPTTTAQVRFLQYYCDLFQDLLHAYGEFRWRGAELLCACCPPEGLFPRHLMLGLLHPEKATQPGRYRQAFLPSPAVGDCEAEALMQSFARLVAMSARFTLTPIAEDGAVGARLDPRIRITPSALGDKPLGEKAIPYYYTLGGTPPLYHLWNHERTRRHRAHHNLGYRHDEYTPPAPAFVSEPLRYDLEPYNFLRVEGHLGKDYRTVLSTLLQLKSQYRLPIDVIALRTGAYDDTQPVDLSMHAARFQDLEALYDVQREELWTTLAEGAMELYNTHIDGVEWAGGTPQLPLLKSHAPNYRYPANSVGAWYEKYLNAFQARPYIDVDQKAIDNNAVLTVYCTLFSGTRDLPNNRFAHVVSIYYFSKLAEILPSSLDALGFADFENKYQDLVGLLRFFRSEAVGRITEDFRSFLPQDELIDLFDQVLFDCKLDSVRAVHNEYAKRVGLLRQMQFLSSFLQRHPGIQHKAGVPLGGTFILVYHQRPAPPLGIKGSIIANTALLAEVFAARNRIDIDSTEATEVAPTTTTKHHIDLSKLADAVTGAEAKALALTDVVTRIGNDRHLAEHPDIKLLLGSLTGKIPLLDIGALSHGLDDPAAKIIAAAVSDLADGAVIADFYLPYTLSSELPGMQFVLPKVVPNFNAQIGCTNDNNLAPVALKVMGGVAPYELSVDDAAYAPFEGSVALSVGAHSLRLRDAEGVESSAQTVVIPGRIALGEPTFTCKDSNYTLTLAISGGTPPYTVNDKALDGNIFTSDPVASSGALTLNVTDSAGCITSDTFTHTCPPPCDLPCGGSSLRRGFRFWLPDADPSNAYTAFKLANLFFAVEAAPGNLVDLTGKIGPLLQAKPAELNAGFESVAKAWTTRINKIIANEPTLNKDGKINWLTLTYEPAGPGRLGTLWLEFFTCLKFDIQMTVNFTRGEINDSLKIRYAPEGTSVATNDFKVQIPAFDGSRMDKCEPSKPPENICSDALGFELKIGHVTAGNSATLNAIPVPDQELRYLWEVQDGSPSLGNESSFTTRFRTFGTKVVTVTAFTKTGCRRMQSVQFGVG